jgi:hypothetical protein
MFKCHASHFSSLLLFYTFPPFLLRLFSYSITALLNIPSSSFIPSCYSHIPFISSFWSHCSFIPSLYSHSTFKPSLYLLLYLPSIPTALLYLPSISTSIHIPPLPLFYTFSHSLLLFGPLLQFTCKFLFCFMGNSVKSLD